jgi:hypothetical protein
MQQIVKLNIFLMEFWEKIALKILSEPFIFCYFKNFQKKQYACC